MVEVLVIFVVLAYLVSLLITWLQQKRGLRAIRSLAEKEGHPEMKCILASMYDSGDRITQDHAEAARWYRLAADQGDDESQYQLGRKYYMGEGVEKDEVEAVRWYRLAAGQGFAMAQHNLGRRDHRRAQGTPGTSVTRRERTSRP